MNRKGISQILFLIIAASVLMMVALTLIFMFQSGASDTTEQANAQACRSTAQAKCANIGGVSITAPTSCYTNDAGSIKGTTQYNVFHSDGNPPSGGSPFSLSSHSPPYYMKCSSIS